MAQLLGRNSELLVVNPAARISLLAMEEVITLSESILIAVYLEQPMMPAAWEKWHIWRSYATT
ncbi:hypothetical protein GCM10009022_27990 [Vreelandella titanicae]